MGLLDQIVGEHTKVLRPSGGCHNCPRKRLDFVPATLAKGSVLWLGESPGATDVSLQEHFGGKTGELLKTTATQYGVPGPWSFSSIVHCHPPEGYTLKPKEIGCCLSQFVLDEIRGYPVVVLCGNVPLQALFPGARADHFRGNVAWHPDFPGQRFYTMYAPGYIISRPHLHDEYHQQMARLARIVQGEPAPAWNILRGAAALAELRKQVKLALLSIDLETNRFESWAEDGRIKSLAVTADAKTVVVGHEDDPQFTEMLALVADFLSKPEKSAVGSHISFDLEWLERECKIRVRCELIHDVGIEYYHAKQYKMPSLKELVSRELDGYRFLIHHAHLVQDVDLLLRYNAEDVIYSLQLFWKAMKMLQPKTRDLVMRVLGPADLVLQRMSASGIYLRKDYWLAKTAEYAERRRSIIAAWKAEDPEFIPTKHESGDGLLHYLFTIRGLPVLERTESEQPSTDQSVLKQLVRDGHTIVQHLLDLREVDKIENTYLTPYQKHIWPDSRIRSHYPLTWTDSGRSSSRTPNLQNISRKKEIRDLFGVSAGSVLLESDLSQIEFRIMVCLAKDENGINGYLRGDDAHTITALNFTGGSKPTKEQRTLAKPINFGFLYGAQAAMVKGIAADDYGVIWTDQEAEDFRNIFMRTYPGLPIFHADRKRSLTTDRGWFESAVGHVFHYDDWDHPNQGKRDHAFRAYLNAHAQGPAAQICFYIMVLSSRMLWERGFKTVKFVNTVHDSILTEVPNPMWVPDVVQCITEASQRVHEWVKDWFVVPLIMEHSQGESWGSLVEIKQ